MTFIRARREGPRRSAIVGEVGRKEKEIGQVFHFM